MTWIVVRPTVVDKDGLARQQLTPVRLLMRPQLNGGRSATRFRKPKGPNTELS